MRHVHTALFLLLAISMASNAQGQVEEKSKSETKVESFSAQTSAVIVKGYSETGVLGGEYGTYVIIESREIIEVDGGERRYGISIRVEGNKNNSHTSYIDYENIEPLIESLDYLTEIDKSITDMGNFQADYRTQDDLVLSAFTSGGDIEFSVQSGQIDKQTAFFSISNAKAMKKLVIEARNKIDSLR